MSTTGSGRNDPADESIGQPFDQTNGMMDDEGESDGTAASDTASAAERSDDDVVVGGPTTDDGGAEPTQGDRGLAGGAAGLAVHRGG